VLFSIQSPPSGIPVQRNGSARQFGSLHEWLGVDANEFDSIKPLLISKEMQKLASNVMHMICAMRTAGVSRLSNERGGELQVAIKNFPINSVYSQEFSDQLFYSEFLLDWEGGKGMAEASLWQAICLRTFSM
jgi:hypothetical protein